jgi:hypothetical protein
MRYDVIWDIGDQSQIKTYTSRHEAFDKFKSLYKADGVALREWAGY